MSGAIVARGAGSRGTGPCRACDIRRRRIDSRKIRLYRALSKRRGAAQRVEQRAVDQRSAIARDQRVAPAGAVGDQAPWCAAKCPRTGSRFRTGRRRGRAKRSAGRRRCRRWISPGFVDHFGIINSAAAPYASVPSGRHSRTGYARERMLAALRSPSRRRSGTGSATQPDARRARWRRCGSLARPWGR